MRLVIVESPAKSKTISKYLGKEYTVKSSVGHIRDLPKSNKKAIDIKGGFIPHYQIVPGKEHIVDELKKLAEKADEVILATDPDREGEAIAWHIAETAGLKNPERVVFHEITEEAVQEAMRHPRRIDEHLRTAQEARRVLDRLIGYDLSGLIWKKLRYGLSAGRVQSPALRILMEREREIRAFIPERFWLIFADLKKGSDAPIRFSCDEEPKTAERAEEIVANGKKGTWKVTDLKETEMFRSPRPPFTTSTLQQAASTRLGFPPSRTMQIAQRLYEAGHITYMRTDSTNLSLIAVGQIIGLIEKKFGKEFAKARVFKTKSKNAQEAHEAIRPSHIGDEKAGATDEQKKLYSLIWERTVASQMTEAKVLKTKIIASTADDSVPSFAVLGSRVLFAGWLLADYRARGEDVEVPHLSVGDSLQLHSIESVGKETEPPKRYSEAGLVKELEKRGIGRPSTYASIIKTLQDRGYVAKENKSLIPTDTGDAVSSFLESHFGDYISDTFTAGMEESLDQIARGEKEYKKTLKDFYTPFHKEVESKESIEKITNLGEASPEWKCPVCGGPMIIKLSRSGKFMSCAKFPECTGARTIEGGELAGPKETGEECPECKKGKLVERDGRFGRFIACGNYPKCKYIKKDPSLLKTTGIKCPTCKTGEMAERRGRFGLFYSCSNYPDCKYAIKAKPTGNICTLCSSLMMQGTKTIPERCSNKQCPMHNPHKLEKEKK